MKHWRVTIVGDILPRPGIDLPNLTTKVKYVANLEARDDKSILLPERMAFFAYGMGASKPQPM